MRRTANLCVRCGSSRYRLVYGLILLLLQSNCAVSKILDEETGQCRYTLLVSAVIFFLYCGIESLCFQVNSRQIGLYNKACFEKFSIDIDFCERRKITSMY